MKIQAIATLLTASAVSFFQATKPAPDPTSPNAAESAPAEIAAAGGSTWTLIPGDSLDGVVLFQSEVQPDFGATLTQENEGGFAAGGVVELAETPEVLDEVIMEIDGSTGAVVDTVDVPVTAPVDQVSEIRVAAVEDSVDGAIEEEVATGEAMMSDAESEVEVAQAGEVLKEGETPLPLAGVMDEEPVDDSPVEPVTAGLPEVASAVEDYETGTGATGFADRLVDRVTEAVSGESAEEAAESEGPTMGEEDDGFWLRAARLNDVFQYLARLGHYQYFHNADLDAANFVVTGHLSDGDPLQQMEELGLMYGITIHRKGNTVYAMTEAQLAQLPTKPYYYQLKYLRPSDIEQIRGILEPLMTAGSGTVDFETKTNTLVFIDNEQRIESIKEILSELDRPKKQIAIETRILRIKSGARNRIGVDWESVLGDGMTIQGVESLNTLFNLPDSDLVEQVITKTFTGGATSPFTISNVNTRDQETTFGNITGTNDFEYSDSTTQTINSTESQLVLSPLQLQATIRALNTGGLAQQESSPTLITEDNESGIISIIDRIPIITATVSETTAGQNITEEVRYVIDQNDASTSDDPTMSREIGVTVSVTPTILPDDTIRMALRPRSSQIVEFIEGRSGNLYPRVNESTVDTIARVPNGFSLLIGGFYEEQESDETKKVPVLGDVPGLNFMFKSTDTIKEHTSLVFVVTPKLYEPARLHETELVNRELHQNHVLPNDHHWPDRKSPGDNYEPNLGWTLGNAVNAYPPTPPSNALHPDHPVNLPTWDASEEPGLRQGQTMVEPEPVVAAPAPRKGLFGTLFKKRDR